MPNQNASRMILREIPGRPGFFRLESLQAAAPSSGPTLPQKPDAALKTNNASDDPPRHAAPESAAQRKIAPERAARKKKHLKMLFNEAVKSMVATAAISLVGIYALRGMAAAYADKIEQAESVGGVPGYLVKNWNNVWQKQASSMADPQNAAAYDAWLKQFDPYKNASLMEKAKIVDQAVDQLISYQFDEQTFGPKEYWASPHETLTKRRGDCEDYAILKYDVLTNYLGTNGQECFLALVDSTGGTSTDHVVVLLNFGPSDSGQGPGNDQFYMLNNNTYQNKDGQDISATDALGTVEPVSGPYNYVYGFSPRGPNLFSAKK